MPRQRKRKRLSERIMTVTSETVDIERTPVFTKMIKLKEKILEIMLQKKERLQRGPQRPWP